jgi:hypothetical protein
MPIAFNLFSKVPIRVLNKIKKKKKEKEQQEYTGSGMSDLRDILSR